MRQFDLHMTYFQVARRFLIIFGIIYLLVFAQLSRRASDSATFYGVSAFFVSILLLGTYYRYVWYFKNSTLTIDDLQIKWHRNNEDHHFNIPNISGVRLPNQIAQYYGMSYFQLKFNSSPSLNLDIIVPAYDDIVAEIVARMKKHTHLQEFVKEIEDDL
jgi:hypothetical protein